MRTPWLLALLPACAPGRAEWSDVPITAAWLAELDLSSIAVVGGAVAGDAELLYDGPRPGAIPVHLGGGKLGALLHIAVDIEGHDGDVLIDLSDVRDPTVGDVLGTYRGTSVGGDMIVGGTRRRMRNGPGASFREDHFELGLGFWAGFEWVTIKERAAEAPVDETATAETGSPETPVDTATAEDTATADDTGSPVGAVGGEACGCDHRGGSFGGWFLAAGGLLRRRSRAMRTVPGHPTVAGRASGR